MVDVTGNAAQTVGIPLGQPTYVGPGTVLTDAQAHAALANDPETYATVYSSPGATVQANAAAVSGQNPEAGYDALQSQGGVIGQTATATTKAVTSTAAAASSLFSGDGVFRVLIGVTSLVLLAIGLAAIALKTDAGQSVLKAAKEAVVVA